MYQILIMLIPLIYSHCTEKEFRILNVLLGTSEAIQYFSSFVFPCCGFNRHNIGNKCGTTTASKTSKTTQYITQIVQTIKINTTANQPKHMKSVSTSPVTVEPV